VSAILLVGLTSLGAYLVGARGLGLSRAGLGGALCAMLEAIGMATVFLLANIGLAALGLGLVRGAGGHFISVYSIDDFALVTLSSLQGFVFRWWWGRR
jgi:hypothetical protein